MDASQFEPAWDGSGLEDPRYIREFEADLTADWDNGGQDDAFGIKVIFVAEDDDNKRQSLLMPWLSFDRLQAHMLVQDIVSDKDKGPEVLTAWLSTGSVNLEEGVMWHPLAAKVVHLAEVPF